MKPRLAVLFMFVLAGCLGPTQKTGAPAPGVPAPPPEIVTEPLPEGVTPVAGALAVVWLPAAQTNPLAAAQYLKDRPQLRVTAVLPERFFDEDDDARRAKAIFATLVSSRQVEIVM